MKKTKESEQKVAKTLDDLRLVGPDKPVGYLPLDTLIDECQVNPLVLAAELRQKGLQTMILNEETSGVHDRGALYAYDPLSLQALLDSNRQTLETAGWSTDPQAFILSLKDFVPQGTDLFDLIAAAFGTKAHPI